MSHYPTSAELAAFRRSMDDKQHPAIRCPFVTSGPHDGAFQHELQHGIGYDHRCQCGFSQRDHTGFPDVYHGNGSDRFRCEGYQPATFGRHTFVRHEASAMRSRAYARALDATGCEDCILIGNHSHPCRDLALGVEAFTPSWNPYVDGERIVASDCWDDDEPRHPLPIVYHKPFSILA